MIKKQTKIMIVDDHPVVREGLKDVIDREPDLKVVSEAEDFDGTLHYIANNPVEVLIIDVSLKAMQNGIDLVKRISAEYPEIKVLVLSMHDESVYAERALKAGALGYIMKHEAGKKILDSIRKVREGDLAVSETVAARMMKSYIRKKTPGISDFSELLSDRELEVFSLIGRGMGTSDIAKSIGISISTVETYRAKIKEKLQIDKSGELVKVAVEWAMTHRI